MVVAVVLQAVAFIGRDVSVPYDDAAEHFKYGSIGAGGLPEIPLPIFLVLPDLFSDLLPPGPGTGYARLGFFYAVRDMELGEQLLGVDAEFPYWEDPSLWSVLELVREGRAGPP